MAPASADASTAPNTVVVVVALSELCMRLIIEWQFHGYISCQRRRQKNDGAVKEKRIEGKNMENAHTSICDKIMSCQPNVKSATNLLLLLLALEVKRSKI